MKHPAAVLAAVLLAAPARADLTATETLLLPAVPAPGERFGDGVALDGDTLVVAQDHNSNTIHSLFFFDRVAGVWTESQRITLPGLPAATGGAYLALDGDTCATGITGAQVRVFERAGGTWSETATLSAPGGSSVKSVALSGDRLVATFFTVPGVWVWNRAGGAWPAAPDDVVDLNDGVSVLGFAFHVDVDGDRIAASSSDPVAGIGQVHVLELAGGAWVETARLQSPLGAFSSGFGTRVACTATHVAASAPTTGPVTAQGAVEVFELTGSGWAFQAHLEPQTGQTYDDFGEALDLAGGRLAVGSPGEGQGDRGAAYLFTLGPAGWTQTERLVPGQSPVADMKFGEAVSLSGDELAVGAPDHDFSFNQTGSAWHYRFDATPPAAYCTAKPTTAGCVPSVAWQGGATYTGSDDFVVLGTGVPAQKTGLFFHGTSGPAALPFLGGTLCVQPALTRTLPQAAQGANPCSASYAQPFGQADMQAAGLAPGDTLWGQWWLRDPQNPDGTGVALSDGIAVEIAP